MQSCTSMFGGGSSGLVASSYLSEDADLTGAEAAYCEMEAELQEYLNTYEATHDYDEYHFDLDEIEHDPMCCCPSCRRFTRGCSPWTRCKGIWKCSLTSSTSSPRP